VNALLDVNIAEGAFVYVMYGLAGITVAALILIRPSAMWTRSGWLTGVAWAIVTGVLLTVGLIWWLIDATDTFGLDPTWITKTFFAAGIIMLTVILVGLWRATWKRRIASVGAALVIVLTVAMGINIDFGQYSTVRSTLGISEFATATLPLPITTPVPSASRATVATWRAPASMPAVGTVASVVIPGTISGFAARNAVVYLPPAALTANPPLLPVMVLLSGQPGIPDDMFNAAGALDIANKYAATHGGLAPIIVAPDQLGSRDANPMCIDSPLGNSATYLTQDVPNWIRANLGVLTDRSQWAIGGFSQGGTCAIQLGAGFPQLFGTLIDISGELDVSIGTPAKTIKAAFGGNKASYDAAQPLAKLTAGTPFADTYATFAVGANDKTYRSGQQQVAEAAKAAGMKTDYFEVPNSAHDWNTAGVATAKALTATFTRWNLTPATA
jgi:S-formylglutathione hydrolase FrmB